jgi:hypothetical protein
MGKRERKEGTGHWARGNWPTPPPHRAATDNDDKCPPLSVRRCIGSLGGRLSCTAAKVHLLALYLIAGHSQASIVLLSILWPIFPFYLAILKLHILFIQNTVFKSRRSIINYIWNRKYVI